MMPVLSPVDLLLPYQRKWFDDRARFKMGMWSRQTGKSFANAAEIVADCQLNSGAMWVVLSVGERQALEWMQKGRQWTEAFDLTIKSYDEFRDHKEALINSAEIKYDNGSRIVAIPANPATARGYSANLFLDEFAFHERPDEIWKAIYPSISNPLKGKLKLRISSTPNGKGNKFYELWTKNNSYSKHLLTVYDAVAQGLPLDPEELKAAIDDPDAWAQEYLCEFIDSTSILLPYELIAGCESDQAAMDEAVLDKPAGSQIFCGVDIGRKKDLTVCWTIEKLGDVCWTREVLCLERMPFADQLDILCTRIAAADRAAVDSTGIGAMIAEELARKFGTYRVSECQFSAAFKGEIMTHLRRMFEDRAVRIPVNRTVREDLHSLQKITSQTGGVKYSAPRTDDGHADRSTALALALHAAKDGGVWIPPPRSIAAHRRTENNRRIRELAG
jgi:phage FluMu gp28-like protein